MKIRTMTPQRLAITLFAASLVGGMAGSLISSSHALAASHTPTVDLPATVGQSLPGQKVTIQLWRQGKAVSRIVQVHQAVTKGEKSLALLILRDGNKIFMLVRIG